MAIYDPATRTVAAIATRLAMTREALELSQAEVSRRTGIKPNTYNQYEMAKGRPNIDHANKLCDGLNITLDWVYRGDQGGLPAQILDKLRAHPANTPTPASTPRRRSPTRKQS